MLSTMPCVIFANQFWLSQFTDAEMAREGITPNVVAEVDTIALVVACVARGFGVAVVPYFALLESPVNFVIAAFGEPQVYRKMSLIERKADSRQVLIVRLHEHIATACGEYGLSRCGDGKTPPTDPNAG